MVFVLALVAFAGTAEVIACSQDLQPVPIARRDVRAACPRTMHAALSYWNEARMGAQALCARRGGGSDRAGDTSGR
jgi:hypothetical protein